ncbi:hypothetical protein PHISP_02653 [Aspergillus sp. HF37]|nr:hypothetical protein PHISP_02653 [Aspergillus sp. HF37]
MAGERRCPACQTALVNPDDAASTILNPTEDYKTSVLSGLDPNTVMECAGRALAFWAYQTTQEVFYQEFLGKTLTDKYTSLNTQMDRVVHNANTEISSLQSRVSDMQNTQDQLHKKNQELVDLYRDKCKKFTQITNLYNILKSRAMRSQMQTAASDSVSRTLNSLAPSRTGPSTSAAYKPVEVSDPPQTPRQQNMYPGSRDGVEQLHRYQRSGTGSSRGKQKRPEAAAMPPPSRPRGTLRNTEATPHRTQLTSVPRPSTGLSQFQLPTDQAMLERFQDGATPAYGASGQ